MSSPKATMTKYKISVEIMNDNCTYFASTFHLYNLYFGWKQFLKRKKTEKIAGLWMKKKIPYWLLEATTKVGLLG